MKNDSVIQLSISLAEEIFSEGNSFIKLAARLDKNAVSLLLKGY